MRSCEALRRSDGLWEITFVFAVGGSRRLKHESPNGERKPEVVVDDVVREVIAYSRERLRQDTIRRSPKSAPMGISTVRWEAERISADQIDFVLDSIVGYEKPAPTKRPFADFRKPLKILAAAHVRSNRSVRASNR